MKIFYIMGKSSTGKDTIYKELMSDSELNLTRIVPYTTRPIRTNEKNGVDYNFVTNEEFYKMKSEGKIIESRSYNTENGIWTYFTPIMELDDRNYISIGTLESYNLMKKEYGEQLIPIYIELDDGVRLQRALNRELSQKMPNYAEMCRRYLADTQDFSNEKLLNCNINKHFVNDNLQRCTNEIKSYIKENLT